MLNGSFSRFTVGATSETELRQIVNAGGRRAEIYRALAALRDTYAEEIRRRFSRNLTRQSSGFAEDSPFIGDN